MSDQLDKEEIEAIISLDKLIRLQLSPTGVIPVDKYPQGYNRFEGKFQGQPSPRKSD